MILRTITTERARSAFAIVLAVLASSCQHPPPNSNPHYVLGLPYQSDGVWFYPRDDYAMQETGLAIVYPAEHPELTTDGEVFDQTALAAAHQTLQLPAVGRLTDLESGRQILVRINDRGPATPHRMIEITRRAATLLDFPADGVARVRLEVLPEESHAAVEAVPGTPRLDIAMAPVGAVQQSKLPPPGSAAPEAPAVPMAPPSQPQAHALAKPDVRLPDTVTQVSPDPGSLFVVLGTFHGLQYADIQRARVAGIGANIVTAFEGRAPIYRVMVGPFTSVPQADAALDQVLQAGVTDARIVVE